MRLLAADHRFGKIYAVSRRQLYDVPENTQHLCLDLLDADRVKQALSDQGVRDVTHVFQNAYAPTGDHVKDVEVNFGMHKNIIEGLEAVGNTVQHVYFNAGGKWYGQALGPILKTPSREDDPRHLPPNFYYDMQDYCAQRVRDGATWTWSSLRPYPVAGYSRGSAMNITMCVAVYGSICKELGLPAMRFPGTELSWNALNDCVDVDLLAEATIFCATHKEAANQAFNIHNGDYFRWRDVWPQITAFFGMEAGYPQPMQLTDMMKDKEPVWESLVKKHGLERIAFKDVAAWEFADFVFHQPSDWTLNTNKLRQAGFNGMKVDTDKMFLRHFADMATRKIIPSPTKTLSCR
ncbi:hypothetical protein WJX72_005112 [[Myrmecia] bisecta]|uniref:PRISE-like Rossmann-fold domain-containing protein n=1 Tax=[Myrmecia] bisecta TaxID=41462 RepID=A0AAW1PJT6_9CHLO